MDQQTNKQEPSSKEGGEVKYKVGDKVWVLCEVAAIYKDRADVYMDMRHDGAVFEAKASDCRPVEPAVIKQSLTTESNSSEIPNSSSEPLKVGDAVRFVWPGHKHHRAKGVVKSVTKEDGEYLFESDCGRFGRWCPSDQIERLNQVDPINPAHYKHLPAEAIDIIMAAIAKAPSNQSAFLQGQVIKYMLRCWSKKGIEDVRKAKWYLDRLVNGFDRLSAEASGVNDEAVAVKRYRTPTLADLANGHIFCESRDSDWQEWKTRILTDILGGPGYPFLCLNAGANNALRYAECRVEVSE